MTDDRTPSKKSKPRLEKKQRSRKIGDQLRTLYDEVAQEPIPDEFMSLLEAASDRAKSDKTEPDD